MDPMEEDVEGFEKFMEKYMKNLPAEKAAVEHCRHILKTCKC